MVGHNLPPNLDRANISENLGKAAALPFLPLITSLSISHLKFAGAGGVIVIKDKDTTRIVTFKIRKRGKKKKKISGISNFDCTQPLTALLQCSKGNFTVRK